MQTQTQPQKTPLQTTQRTVPERANAEVAPTPVVLAPALDVFESPEAFLLVFDVPGVPQEDVVLEIEQRALRLEATQSRPLGRRPVRFERSIGLPSTVNSEAVSAELALGVLTVRLPKREDVKPRTIPIRGEGRATT